MSDASNLPQVSRGAVVKGIRGWVMQAILDSIRDRGLPPGDRGFKDVAQTIFRPQSHSRDRLSWVACKSDDDIDPYSIVEVYDGEMTDQGLSLFVRIATDDAQLYAGTETYSLKAGAYGWVKLITPYDPVLVSVEGADIEFFDNLSVIDTHIEKGDNPKLVSMISWTDEMGTGTGTGTGFTYDAADTIPVLGILEAETSARFEITEEEVVTGTGTGTGTGTNNTYIHRASHPSGFNARKLDLDDVSYLDDADQLIYADRVRDVFVTGDKVWCVRRGGKWQIRDRGQNTWSAVITSDVQDGEGEARLSHHVNSVIVPVTCADLNDSISATTVCQVIWNDGQLTFRAIPLTCPTIVSEIGTDEPFSETGTGS